MNRYRTYGRLDEGPVEDGDGGFRGVDERDPVLVAPGFVSAATNYVFRNGVATPRRGCVPLSWLNGGAEAPCWPWLHYPGSPLPEHDFTWPKRLAGSDGELIAGCVFRDADDRDWVIVAGHTSSTAATKVWRLREGYAPAEVTLPADMPHLEECSFTQCFNKLIMFRGKQYPALEMSDVGTGFEDISQAANTISGAGTYNPSDGTEVIPQGDHGLFIQNRLLVPHGRDFIAASDFLNYTRYSTTRADFRINQGSNDELVAVFKLGEQSIVAFKEHSIYLVHNVYGDLSELRLEELTRSFGLGSRRAVASTGSDVWFLSQKGITSIALAVDNKLKSTDRWWSDAIPETFRRINWRYVRSKATAVFHDGKVLFAVPLDDAESECNGVEYSGVNNAVLVYDTRNDAWAGVHSGGNLMVREWLEFVWQGKQRLGFISEDGRIYLYDFTFNDDVLPSEDAGPVAEIETYLKTRAYAGRSVGDQEGNAVLRGAVKRWERATVVVATADPELTVGVVVDGVNETGASVVDGWTRDRRQYVTPFDAEDWDIENPEDDWETPGREDYSCNLTRASATDEAAGQILLGTGVNFEQVQDAPVRLKVNRQGRWCEVEITNVNGRCVVKGVEVAGRIGRRRNGVAV